MAETTTAGDEVGGDEVGDSLDGRARTLRLAHHLHDSREQSVAPHVLRLDHEPARAVHRAADDGVTHVLLHRDRLTRDHRLVDAAIALDAGAVDRDLLAGSNAEVIAGLHVLERHIDLTVGGDLPRHLRREVEERADGRARLAPRTELEHLAEQHERGDDRRRLEVHGDAAVVRVHRGREGARCEHRDDAVEERRTGPQRDQREHVQAAMNDGCPATLEERPPAPEHDGCGENELRPRQHGRRDRGLQWLARDHVRHRNGEDGDREHGAHHEPSPHIDELRVVA